MEDDINTYWLYVAAAEHGNDALRCTTTPKVHLMLKHVAWQMENIPGGLGDKMEDFVERMHRPAFVCKTAFAELRTLKRVHKRGRRQILARAIPI
jgi:hypothetical protein